MLLVGVEGVMLTAGFFSIAGVAWTGSVWVGVAIGAGIGLVANLVLGVLTMRLRMGDIVGGLVMHVGAIGVTGFLLSEWFPTGLTTGGRLLEPLWGEFGPGGVQVVFHQQPLVYAMLVIALGIELFLVTRWGLRVRASGESMRAATSFGVDLERLRFTVLAGSGLIIGLAGAVVGIGIVGTFDTQIVAGRGFIALACVILGAWRAFGALGAALVFGAAYALQFRVGLESLGGWLQLLPYVLVLIAIAAFWGRRQGPAEEGKGLPDDPGR
jgi:simple sugar transport system permease protein